MEEILMLPNDPLSFGKFPECPMRCGFGKAETQRFQSLNLLFSVPNSSYPPNDLGSLPANSHSTRAMLVHLIPHTWAMATIM